MEPDLQVLPGSTPYEGERFMVYSQVLALQSDYVRGKLTNFNHRESMTMIRFPNASQSTWDKVMKFLQPYPLPSKSMWTTLANFCNKASMSAVVLPMSYCQVHFLH